MAARAEDGAEHLLGGGLADATRDRNHGESKAVPPARGDTLQGGEGIHDLELRQRVVHGTRDEGTGGAAGAGLGKEVMTVAPARGERDESVALTQ
jgi:hypothetical protein